MDDFATGYLAGQDSGGGNNNGGFGGFGDGWLGLILFAMIFGWGRGGFGGGFGGGGGTDGVSAGFAWQGIDSGIRGIQQGLCDGFYAVNTGMLTGFNGVNSAIANLGFQQQECCCATQRAIDGVNYNMAKGFCDLGNVINMQTRDIIDNQNANYRGLMDFLVQEKLSSKDARIAALEGQLGRAEQNGVIRAAIDASTAEIIRRTGNECPVPAYVVPNPNCCYGNPLGVGYNGGTYGGNGCGCGC